MSRFKDHFSGHAALYRAHRPRYPERLFQWLAAQTPSQSCAWDCATGNGQAAIALANDFKQVIATDASTTQIAQAEVADNVRYLTASAEHSGLPDHSVDLITVAQAAHWFDLNAFYTEAERVLQPKGVIAIWCYGLTRINPEIDAVLDHFYQDTVGPYWPPERRHVETGYRDFAFPFIELRAPRFHMQAIWSPEQLLGYLSSWSAVQHCVTETGVDVIAALAPVLKSTWGEEPQRPVTWPLSMRVGRIT